MSYYVLSSILKKSKSRHFVPALTHRNKCVSAGYSILTEFGCCAFDTIFTSFLFGVGGVYYRRKYGCGIHGNYGRKPDDGISFVEGVVYGIYYTGSISLLSSFFRIGKRIVTNNWVIWKRKL